MGPAVWSVLFSTCVQFCVSLDDPAAAVGEPLTPAQWAKLMFRAVHSLRARRKRAMRCTFGTRGRSRAHRPRPRARARVQRRCTEALDGEHHLPRARLRARCRPVLDAPCPEARRWGSRARRVAEDRSQGACGRERRNRCAPPQAHRWPHPRCSRRKVTIAHINPKAAGPCPGPAARKVTQ